MSGRGPDGYPLDVHGPTLPLPPQDPVWIKGAASPLADRAALARACAGALRRADQPRDHAGAAPRARTQAAARGFYLTRCASDASVLAALLAASVRRSASAGGRRNADADLRVARRHRSPARSRICPPQPIRRPVPVIVFLHGEGGRAAPDDRSRLQSLLRARRVRDGVDRYRLTPSVTFPANVEDVRTAVRWLKANAAAHGLDPIASACGGRRRADTSRRSPAWRRAACSRAPTTWTYTSACVACWTPTGRRASTSWTPRPRRSGAMQPPVVTINLGGGAPARRQAVPARRAPAGGRRSRGCRRCRAA